MMSKRIYAKEDELLTTILSTIQKYGFVATIEVKSDIPFWWNRESARKSIKSAKQNLQKLTGDETEILSGFARLIDPVPRGYLRNFYTPKKPELPKIKEADFEILMEGYQNDTLDKTVRELISEKDTLTEDEQIRLKKLMIKSSNSYTTSLNSLLNPTRSTYEKFSKQTRNCYDKNIASIKGKVAERYVINAISDAMPHKDYLIIGGAILENKEIDIIIASYRKDFFDALDSIVEKTKKIHQHTYTTKK